jgi:hypothetical protein
MAMSAEGTPRLVVTEPVAFRGTVLRIDRPRLVIGRHESVDLRLQDPHVSRRHAALVSTGGIVLLEDLGSTGGTTLNGHRLQRPSPLRHGDEIGFATVVARYEDPHGGGHTLSAPAAPQRPAPSPGESRPSVRYDVGRQTAGQIDNVGGNKYVQHVQESFFREIAAIKTKAGRLVWFGLALTVAGMGVFLWVWARAAGQIDALVTPLPSADGIPSGMPQVFGPEVGGVPLVAFAMGASAIGQVLMLVGLVLHIVAAARRRAGPPAWTRSSPTP